MRDGVLCGSVHNLLLLLLLLPLALKLLQTNHVSADAFEIPGSIM
jgi:hypothetical protein